LIPIFIQPKYPVKVVEWLSYSCLLGVTHFPLIHFPLKFLPPLIGGFLFGGRFTGGLVYQPLWITKNCAHHFLISGLAPAGLEELSNPSEFPIENRKKLFLLKPYSNLDIKFFKFFIWGKIGIKYS